MVGALLLLLAVAAQPALADTPGDCVTPPGSTAVRDLADALAAADPVLQAALVRDCDGELSAELVDQLVGRGILLGSKAQFAREERVAVTAVDIAGRLGDAGARARATWLLARAKDSQSRYDDALADYREAHRLAVEAGDRQTVGRALVGLGFTYVNRYELANAREPLREGLAIALSGGDDMIADNAYLAMATMDLLSGQYIDAIRNLDRAREHAEKAGDVVVVAAATANAGLVFSSMNNDELARDRLRQGIEIYRRIGNVRGEMRNLRNLADIDAATGHLDAASEALDRVEAYLGKEPNDRMLAYVAATRATIHRHRDDLAAAGREASRSLEMAVKLDERHLAATMTIVLSEIRFAETRYPEAAELAERAVEWSLAGGSTVDFPAANVHAARAYARLGRTEDAFRALQTAVDSIESQLANVPGTEDDQQAFYSDKTPAYYELFRLLLDQQQPERALEWVERSRSRTLIEILGRSRVPADRNIVPPDEREAESALEQGIVSANRQLRELQAEPSRDAKRIAEAEETLRRQRIALNDFNARLQTRHPELVLSRAALPRPTLADTQKLIPADGAIVEYVVSADDTWVVVITRTGPPRIARIGIPIAKLTQRVAAFTANMARRDLAIHGEARRMYDLLLGPVRPLLAAKRSLCIIPDGPLWHVPFQALAGPDGRYVIEHAVLFYAPSRSLLAWYASHAGEPAGAGVLVVANPRLTERTVQTVRAVRRDERLGPLPDAEREARRIQGMYGRDVTVVTGARATEEFVKSNAGRYRMIHLATHAAFDDTSPLYSHLVLAAASASGEDGLLEARELVHLDLAADLVVLSSCETGRGQVRGGEGLIGMSWALLVAGCPTAVVSHWKVESAGTARLMIELHRRLARVPAKDRRAAAARALRKAQLALMQARLYQHPYDWSGFAVVGNGW